MIKLFKQILYGLHGFVVVFLFFSTTSCVNTKKAAYFYGIGDTTISSSFSKIPEPVIYRNDILTISVSSPNPEADVIFNAPNMLGQAGGMGGGGSIASQTAGYLVSPEGNIQFPVLGTIKVAGLTKTAIKDLITKELVDKKLLIEPVVNIRIINFKITVMGEVRNPTVFSVPSEKISILEALGMAGDLTVYAKRDNILLIREVNGEKMVRRLDLNSKNLLESPYYYLKSNDVIYVEPNAARLSSGDRSMQIWPLVLSTVSVLAVVTALLIK
ncbi:MAG: polysaccharide biosynthesis/export family protein [Bacteroidetes bacterium]|nr:polysaccharide biosynthesis/export family protein [Bacteroidota bacterium]